MDSRHGADLASAARHLADQCRDALRSGPGLSDTTGIRAAMDCVQALLLQLEPTAFVQQLADQSQLLACVQWLGEFQVLAYLPLEEDDGLPIKDVAELADVPEAQLCRIVRLTAMGGFLREPQAGFMAHTALSASFVRRPAQLDAAMFLAETVAPCVLHMAAVSRRPLAERLAVDWGSKRVQRLWPSFLGALGGGDDDSPILAQVDWASLARDGALSPPSVVVVVDDGPGGSPLSRSAGGPPRGLPVAAAVHALAKSHPTLRFVVQTDAAAPPSAAAATGHDDDDYHHHNLSLCQRAHGTPQTVADAAIYLVRLAATAPVPVRPRIAAELRAHLPVLQAQRGALLILTLPLLPEPGVVSRQTEQLARLRDLSRLQLVGSGLLTLQQLVDLVDGIQDGDGGLVVVKQLHAPNSAFVGLGVRYQPLLPLTG
ncbi:hypothetical protein T440DRAFT_523182 [Plenodomus tracheiphilus IPT5]|uniref:Uncharacterized protein n=1 Tax=Plenodomus tracheiphilus IPT5 TaxID=1408161 RepID=A0A6A7ANK7_9PLEO|nr:hypothetical protein T440DRAFT_523182 [Plenodomus tracheiphilus IPT5]